MPSYTWQTTASGNDANWQEGNSGFTSTSANCYAGGYYDGSLGRINSFARFVSVAIPQGATILSAKLTLTANENKSLTTVNSILSAIDADNPSAPTTYSGAETATRTTATVAWDDIGAWTLDTAYDSPDITTIIQEIVDRPGWASGNAIVVYLEDAASTAVNGTYRRAYSYNGSSVKAPQLYVSWVGQETLADTITLTETVDLVETVDRIYKTGADSISISESIKIDKSLVITDTITAQDSVVPTIGSYAEVLSHPHTAKLYLAVKTPRVVWTGRVLNNRGYNQDGDVEADLQININSTLSYGNVSGFDITNFMPDLTLWVGTTASGKEHGVCRARVVSGTTLTVSADMTCVWREGDYVSITDLHELWPMPHVVTESESSITVLKDHDLAAGTYKDEYPVPVMGPSACAFLSSGTVTVRFNGADSYLVQPNSDEHYWTAENGISGYSWWFEGASVTTSSLANPTATYTVAGQYVVSLELTGENGKTFKGFRNVFIYDDDNPPITDFAINSMSGSLERHGWEAQVEVFGDAFNPTNLPDKAEAILFAKEYFNGTLKTLAVGHAATHDRDNIKLVGYASDTSLSYESGKVRSATMTIAGLQAMLEKKTNFPVYLTQIETGAPSWSYFSDGLTVRLALYHLVRWHWTLLRFADYLIPDDHNNYFPGQNWAEGSLADQLNTFCPDIQARWSVDKTGALMVFSWPNYLPVSGDGAGWRTRLYQDVTFTDADFVKLTAENRIREQVARVRVEGVFATDSEYWTSVDTAPGNSKNHGGGTELIQHQILGTGGFAGSQGEELARMIYAEESRRYERISMTLCGNYSFLDVVPGANYFKLTATPSNLRGLSWTAKPFWVNAVNLSFDHENGDIGTSITAIPETFPDPDLEIYSQYDEIGEDITSAPEGGGFAVADLLKDMDKPTSKWVPALMGDGGSQTEGAEAGTSIVRLFGDANQTVVAENRLLMDLMDRPIVVEITQDASTGKPNIRVAGARLDNDTDAVAESNRAFTTRYANYTVPGAVRVMATAAPFLVLGTRMPKAKIVAFIGRLGVGSASVNLLLNDGLLSTVSLTAEVTTTVAVDRNIVTGDYLSIQVTSATGASNMLVSAECLVYGI